MVYRRYAWTACNYRFALAATAGTFDVPGARMASSRLALCFLLVACSSSAPLGSADGSVSPPTPDAPAPPADAPPGAMTRITFTNQLVDGSAANAGFVAFQDGDGAWKTVAGAQGVYAFDVVGPRYGIAAACLRDSDGSGFVTIGYFTVGEGAARYALDGCAGDDDEDSVLVSGTIRNAAPGAGFFITDGLDRRTVTAPGPFTVAALAGAGTLAAISLDLTRMSIQPASFSEGATLDIDAAGSFALAEAALTLDLDTQGYLMQTRYVDESGGLHRVDANQTANGFVATRYRAVPSDRLGGGINTIVENGESRSGLIQVVRAFRAPVPQVLRLPAGYALDASPLIETNTPYPILAAKLPKRAGASHYTLSYERSSPRRQTSSTWILTFSAPYADATPGAALKSVLPDLSTLEGWKADYALGTDGTLFWVASVNGGPARLVPGAAPFRAHGRSTAVAEDGDETTMANTGGSLP